MMKTNKVGVGLCTQAQCSGGDNVRRLRLPRLCTEGWQPFSAVDNFVAIPHHRRFSTGLPFALFIAF